MAEAVTGGSGHLTFDPIDLVSAMASVATAADGALATFTGMVRDHHNGRPVLRLEYEAHTTMADRQVARLVASARERWDVTGIRVLHRLGTLAVGEVAVVVVVAAAHRGDAMEACRWIIDTLKAEVPIFKKEWYADESAWIEDQGASARS